MARKRRKSQHGMDALPVVGCGCQVCAQAKAILAWRAGTSPLPDNIIPMTNEDLALILGTKADA